MGLLRRMARWLPRNRRGLQFRQRTIEAGGDGLQRRDFAVRPAVGHGGDARATLALSNHRRLTRGEDLPPGGDHTLGAHERRVEVELHAELERDVAGAL